MVDPEGLQGGYQQEIGELIQKMNNTAADIAKRRLAVRNNASRANPLTWSTPDYKTNHRASVKGHIWKITELKKALRNQSCKLGNLQNLQKQFLLRAARGGRKAGFVRPGVLVKGTVLGLGALSVWELSQYEVGRPAGPITSIGEGLGDRIGDRFYPMP